MLWRNKAQPNSFVRMHYNPYDNVAVQTYGDNEYVFTYAKNEHDRPYI